jgi:hypothetical protein
MPGPYRVCRVEARHASPESAKKMEESRLGLRLNGRWFL